jgi:hypothetical protein
MKQLTELSHHADILALPFWLIAVNYFWSLQQRNTTEDILLFFTICGLLFDTIFTLNYLT